MISGADAVTLTPTCSITPAQFDAAKSAALALIQRAEAAAYTDFPIDREAMANTIVDEFVTANSICQAIVAQVNPGSEGEINKLQHRLRSEGLSPSEAGIFGVIFKQLPHQHQCRGDIDPSTSPAYLGVKTCADVEKKLGSDGIITAMVAITDLAAERAREINTTPRLAPQYTEYPDKSWPHIQLINGSESIVCHQVEPSPWVYVNYAIHSFFSGSWVAWRMEQFCNEGGEPVQSELLFNFGFRVFFPVQAMVDGKPVNRTMSIAQGPYKSGNLFAGTARAKRTMLRRFLGKELALRLTIENNGRAKITSERKPE